MAVYRFKVVFEDYDDVIREIDIRSTQTFLDLHKAIHQSTGYNAELPSSFYRSNEQWTKGEEITYLPNQRRQNQDLVLMEDAKLNRFIDDPHQKFYYTFNFDRPFFFHVQLIKIMKEEDSKDYPVISKTAGIAPKAVGAGILASGLGGTSAKEEYDFLNETEYGIEDKEDLDLDMMDGEDEKDDSNSGDEFGDEFSDNSGYEEEDY